MALFDENGNPIDEYNNFPTIPEQPPRQVDLSIKDNEDDNYAKVDADGNLQVKVTEMPPITVDVEGIVVNVANQVEVTNTEGDPIPVSGTVDVGNFPETQAVSIADTVDVSIVGEPTVTISNPVTEVSVSNFPDPVTDVTVSGGVEVTNFPDPITSIEVSNFPEPVTDVTVSGGVEVTNFPEPITSIEVSNFPEPVTELSINNLPLTTTNPAVKVTNADGETINVSGIVTIDNDNINVTVSNPVSEVTVSNFPTEIAVNNHPTTIEVSNFPEPVTEVTVGNFPTTIEVSNQPTTIEVSNFPDAVTEVSVSNMLQANDIVSADKNYIDTQYTIFSDNATFYADAMPPSTDPFGRDGMHYLNNYAVGATTAQKKINWYYYDPSRITARYSEYQNTWALVTLDKVKNPYFVMYTGASLTALPTSTYVWAVPNIVTQVSTTYLFWTGIEEPPATLYPDVPRVQLTLTTSSGTRVATEYILAISLHTGSGEISNTVELQVYKLGYKVLNKNYDVKLEMKNANSTSITGSVEITNDSGNAIPVSGTVNANVTFPITQAVTGDFYPTTQPVSGSVTVSGTVDVGNLTFPDVQSVLITNETLTVDVNNLSFPEVQTVDGTVLIDSTTAVNVTVSNPTTTVSVDALPAIEITNTGFDVTNTPTVKIDATDNTVKIDDSTPVDVNITNTLTIEPPANQDVTITNTSVNVTIDNPTTTVSVDALPAIAITNTGFDVTNSPTVQLNTGYVDNNNKPSLNIKNPTNDVGAIVPLQISGTVGLDGTQNVNVTNTSINATITNEQIEVKNDNGTPLSVYFPSEPSVLINSTTAIKVDGSAVTQPVSGTVSSIITSPQGSQAGVTNVNGSDGLNVTLLNPQVSISNTPSVTVTNPQTSVDVTSLPNITIQNTGFNVNNSPTVKIDATDNTVKIASNQSVNIGNTPSVTLSGTSNAVNATITGAGTSAATPLYMVIVGSIDGGAI